MGGGGQGTPIFFTCFFYLGQSKVAFRKSPSWDISSSWVKMMLHTKTQLPRLGAHFFTYFF